MNNSQEPANPITYEMTMTSGHTEYTGNAVHLGLTKREYFAGLAMQGLLISGINNANTASNAVQCSDELLKQLEK